MASPAPGAAGNGRHQHGAKSEVFCKQEQAGFCTWRRHTRPGRGRDSGHGNARAGPTSLITARRWVWGQAAAGRGCVSAKHRLMQPQCAPSPQPGGGSCPWAPVLCLLPARPRAGRDPLSRECCSGYLCLTLFKERRQRLKLSCAGAGERWAAQSGAVSPPLTSAPWGFTETWPQPGENYAGCCGLRANTSPSTRAQGFPVPPKPAPSTSPSCPTPDQPPWVCLLANTKLSPWHQHSNICSTVSCRKATAPS